MEEAQLSKRSKGKARNKDLGIAFGHPIRRHAWRVVKAAGPEGISPTEIGLAMEVPLSNISYHVRVLAEARAIRCERQEPVGGSVAHFYVVNPIVASLDWVNLITQEGAPTVV